MTDALTVLRSRLQEETIADQMERLFSALDDDNRVVASHARRHERAQMEAMGTKRTHELHAKGELFGMTTRGDTVTVYIEDDENWHPVMSFHSAWLPDLAGVVESMRVHLAKARP